MESLLQARIFIFVLHTHSAPSPPNAATPAAVWEPGHVLLRLPPTLPSPHSPQASQRHSPGPLSTLGPGIPPISGSGAPAPAESGRRPIRRIP